MRNYLISAAELEGDVSKPDISIEAFLAFCESKPADETYPYNNDQRCACAQFAKATGQRFDRTERQWRILDAAAFAARPRTFGAARTFGSLAARLRSHIAARPS